MILPEKEKNIRYLKGVGDKKAALYKKLGVSTVEDLLNFYPRAYIDFSSPTDIDKAQLNEICVIKARVYKKQPEQRIRKGMSVFKVFVSDGTGDVVITIFNSRYLYNSLELDNTYYFYGKITGNLLRREMTSPLVAPESEENLIRPVYHQTEGLSSKAIASNVKTALDQINGDVYDPISPEILRKYGLCHISYALSNIHFPKDSHALAEARRRLVFEELFILQMGLLCLRARNRLATPVKITDLSLDGFYKLLPFELTGAQKRAISDALGDFSSGVPMNRLLQGDVGSGKTMVAAALAYVAAKNSYQTAVMAPTEILASQHYVTFEKLFSKTGIKTCLISGSLTPSQKRRLKQAVADGEYDIIVGTHALVQDSVSFSRLGLVITDEQHRFGVNQRGALAGKGEGPHVLVMSATPIPRTLALIIYGDLDVSELNELPAGRQKVKTLVIDSSKRERAFSFIKKSIEEGRQAYIVCPLIEENGNDLADVTGYYHNITRGFFKGIPAGLLHGRLSSDEKERIMAEFKKGDIKLLVSTTVIEVGIDVPNATIMLIENAERYGLSQLHQLRGRVGRGSEQSFCILLSDNRSPDAKKRLKTMANTSDGFEIAKEDLKLRGPGDFFGERQHGLPKLKIANMANDFDVLKETAALAKEIISKDPDLEFPENRGIKDEILKLFASSGGFSSNFN